MRSTLKIKSWSCKAEQVAQIISQEEVDEPSLFSPIPTRDSFLERFAELQSKFFDGRSTFHTSRGQSPDDQHLSSLFLVPTSAREDDREYSWADVLVIGEVSEGTGSCRQQFLHLCGHA
jgi:hypothetical protein